MRTLRSRCTDISIGELDLTAELEVQRRIERCPRCVTGYAALRVPARGEEVGGAGGIAGEQSPRTEA